jgi:cell wall-associated NlpC family hydrolase
MPKVQKTGENRLKQSSALSPMRTTPWISPTLRRAGFFLPLLTLGFALSLTSGCSMVSEKKSSALDSHYPAPLQEKAAASPQAAKALEVALKQRGVDYRPGGDNPNQGFDCSGLVNFSYQAAGVQLPRDSRSMYSVTTRVTSSDLRPGDLVFFRQRSSTISHVGLYVGSGQFVHAPSSGKDVEITSLGDAYWKKRYVGAGRV